MSADVLILTEIFDLHSIVMLDQRGKSNNHSGNTSSIAKTGMPMLAS